MCEWMGMEHWWNGTDRGKGIWHLENTLSTAHFISIGLGMKLRATTTVPHATVRWRTHKHAWRTLPGRLTQAPVFELLRSQRHKCSWVTLLFEIWGYLSGVLPARDCFSGEWFPTFRTIVVPSTVGRWRRNVGSHSPKDSVMSQETWILKISVV
jgi:hypothetical protein